MKKNPRAAQSLGFIALAVSFFAIAISRAGGTRTVFFALGVVFLSIGAVRALRGGNQ